MRKYFLHTVLFLLAAGNLYAGPVNKYFDELTLAVDTNVYKLSQNTIVYQRKPQLYFEYTARYSVCEVRLYPNLQSNFQKLELVQSAGYSVIDTLVYLENENCYRARIRFNDLLNNPQLSLLINITLQREGSTPSRVITWEMALFPYTQTWVRLFNTNDVLFVGEEKSFDLETNNIDNIKTTSDWQTSNGIDYRVVLRNGRLVLVLQPRELGVKSFSVTLETLAPYLDEHQNLSNKITLSTPPFTIKASRLAFLSLDKKEVTFDDESRSKGVVVTIDNNKKLQVNKTYRIEDQEAPGGSLIAELFTTKDLANDKTLCKLTVFNLHRKTEGYLYIKSCDAAMFLTNIDITPKTQINNIYVLHEGEDWKESIKVNPGEQIDVSVEGTSLHKARFNWQDVMDITSDTISQTERRRMFRLLIPMDINKKQIALLNNGQPTGKYLIVEEYQHPRPFDFVTLNYAQSSAPISQINNIIISRKLVNNFTLSFNNSIIDSKSKLYGKQYLDIEIRVLGRKGEILELRSLKNQLICPDETSPRSGYYKDKNCLSEDINLNNFLATKTAALETFGKVQVDIKQSAEKYSEPTFEKRVEVVYQPKVLFDIDLSLPAGMLIQNLGTSKSEKEANDRYNTEMANYEQAYEAYVNGINNGTYNPSVPPPIMPAKPKSASFIDNLGGVNIALIAQFSFTDDEKAGKVKPYRCGAGFLFINTFNFSSTAKRDLAIVALGSIYPLNNRRMFNLPIHVGLGYKIQDRTPFVMISPGISISF